LNERRVKNRLSVNIALVSIFIGLWVGFNLTVAPLSFYLTGLPVIHSVIIFFTLLLVVWATGQFGAASLVGIIGSAISLLAGGPPATLGFVPGAIVFDLVFLMNRHTVNTKRVNLAIAVFASAICGYVSAVFNGFFILFLPRVFTLTIWAGLVVVGAILGIMLAFPVIRVLERAQVKRVQTD